MNRQVRRTSADVYRKIEESGVLSRRRLEVYWAVFFHGPLTSAEAVRVRQEHRGLRAPRESIAPRFSELKRQGAVREVETRPCRVTGEVSLAWDITGDPPRPLAQREARHFWIVGDRAFRDPVLAEAEAGRSGAEVIHAVETPDNRRAARVARSEELFPGLTAGTGAARGRASRRRGSGGGG